MGEAGRRFRDRGDIVASCDATTPPRSVTAFRQHFAVSSPPVANRDVMRRHGVTTDSPHPRLKKKTLCGPWAIKKTDGLWWVGVCFWRPPWPRVRAPGYLGHSSEVSELAQRQ